MNKEILTSLELLQLERALKLRGYSITDSCSLDRVILPKNKDVFERYYNYLFSYRFRRFLSDIIQIKNYGFFDINLLLTRWDKKEIFEYLDFLLISGIVEEKDNKFYFYYKTLDNFGETLEWFIAQVLKREFYLPVLWGVKLLDISGGGDLDL